MGIQSKNIIICHFCKKETTEYTYWPDGTCKYKKILCNTCAEEHLTAEGYKSQTGLESYKSKGV